MHLSVVFAEAGLRGCVGARGVDGVRRALAGELDVDEGGEALHHGLVLGVVEEVPLAGLVFGIPGDDVELKALGPITLSLGARRGCLDRLAHAFGPIVPK